MVWGQRGRLRSLGSAQTVDVEAEQRSARLRTGTGRTLRRAPGRRLGAGDPIEGLFLGQNCRAVRMGVVPRCYAHCAMAKFRSEVSCPHPSPPMGPSAHLGAILATMPCSQRRESALNRIPRQFCQRDNSLKGPLFANPPTGGAVRRAATPSSGHRGPRGHFWVLRPPLPAGQSGRLSHVPMGEFDRGSVFSAISKFRVDGAL